MLQSQNTTQGLFLFSLSRSIKTLMLAGLCALPLEGASAQDSSRAVDSKISHPIYLSQAEDTSFYEQAKADLGKDWYPVYRVTEKLIRSNGLDDRPWRIQLVDEYSINAYAKDVNLITVYSGLLDQIHGDTSALACVIGHEMSHHTLRHIPLKTSAKVGAEEELKRKNESSRKNARRRKGIFDTLSKTVFKRGKPKILDVFNRPGDGGARKEEKRLVEAQQSFLELSRQYELEADEGGSLMVQRAAYNPEGCIRVINVLASTPTGDLDTTHPSGTSRLEKMKEVLATQSATKLKVEGESNLSKSNKPLTYAPAADGQSLRINSQFGGEWEF